MATPADSKQQTEILSPPPVSSLQSRSSPGPQHDQTTTSAGPKSDPIEAPPPPNPRLQAISTKKATLETTLLELQSQRAALVAETTLRSGLSMPDSWTEEQKAKSALDSANAAIKEHISLLHKYNEIKDVGQGLMGLIAESRGVRIADVQGDYGMGEKD